VAVLRFMTVAQRGERRQRDRLKRSSAPADALSETSMALCEVMSPLTRGIEPLTSAW
jgi:hypothetical protein